MIWVLLFWTNQFASADQSVPSEPGSEQQVEFDEPGVYDFLEDPYSPPTIIDEPGTYYYQEQNLLLPDFDPAKVSDSPRFRLELGAGPTSLLVDPDLGSGYGAGAYLTYGLHNRLGYMLSAFFSKNDYKGKLGQAGHAFLAGNITLGPTVQLTPPGSRVIVSLDFGLGGYLIVPVVQDNVWSLGVLGGTTLAWRLAKHFGLEIRCHYHLFNVFNISGPLFKDLVALKNVGVVDRLEIPLLLAYYF